MSPEHVLRALPRRQAADRLDNLRSLAAPTVTDAFRIKQRSETRNRYLPVFERLLELAPTASAPGLPGVVAEITELATA